MAEPVRKFDQLVWPIGIFVGLLIVIRSWRKPAAQVMLAWLLEHPAGIMPIIGSTTPERIAAATRALQIDYSREDWYRLLEARNGHPVP